jgi:hypothetical protein
LGEGKGTTDCLGLAEAVLGALVLSWVGVASRSASATFEAAERLGVRLGEIACCGEDGGVVLCNLDEPELLLLGVPAAGEVPSKGASDTSETGDTVGTANTAGACRISVAISILSGVPRLLIEFDGDALGDCMWTSIFSAAAADSRMGCVGSSG